MHRGRRIVLISCAILLLLAFQPVRAGDGCPGGWAPIGGWYRENSTCKLRCAQPGQPDWWMDSGGEPRSGCEALYIPALTYFDLWGYTQAPLSDCPPGFEPEHVWFQQGNTCLLECVNKTYADIMMPEGFDRHGWLDVPRSKMRVWVDSGGESRPPWCILEN